MCQDFAHLILSQPVGASTPARHVSGYVKPSGEIATMRGAGSRGNSQVGWIDVDPTHQCLVGNDHVVTAVGRDYSTFPQPRSLEGASAGSDRGFP